MSKVRGDRWNRHYPEDCPKRVDVSLTEDGPGTVFVHGDCTAPTNEDVYGFSQPDRDEQIRMSAVNAAASLYTSRHLSGEFASLIETLEIYIKTGEWDRIWVAPRPVRDNPQA